MATAIRTYGDAVLRREAAPVVRIDAGVKKICERMVEAMIRANGAGIAAPQIGVSKRIIVLDLENVFHILVNPEIVEVSEIEEESAEGCLSVPGVTAPVARKMEVTVRGLTLDGKSIDVAGEGLLARAIQHEIDHLDGILFIDHLSAARRRSLLKEYVRMQKEKSV
jgi:peptide deformylase